MASLFNISVVALILVQLLRGVGGQPNAWRNSKIVDPCTPYNCKTLLNKMRISDPNDCSRYVECRGAKPYTMSCAAGTLFHTTRRDCVSTSRPVLCQPACPLTAGTTTTPVFTLIPIRPGLTTRFGGPKASQTTSNQNPTTAARRPFTTAVPVTTASAATPIPITPLRILEQTTSAVTSMSNAAGETTTKLTPTLPRPHPTTIDPCTFKCTIAVVNEVYPDPNSCANYIQCTGGRELVRPCAVGTNFDRKTYSCIHIENAVCHPGCVSTTKPPINTSKLTNTASNTHTGTNQSTFAPHPSTAGVQVTSVLSSFHVSGVTSNQPGSNSPPTRKPSEHSYSTVTVSPSSTAIKDALTVSVHVTPTTSVHASPLTLHVSPITSNEPPLTTTAPVAIASMSPQSSTLSKHVSHQSTGPQIKANSTDLPTTSSTRSTSDSARPVTTPQHETSMKTEIYISPATGKTTTAPVMTSVGSSGVQRKTSLTDVLFNATTREQTTGHIVSHQNVSQTSQMTATAYTQTSIEIRNVTTGMFQPTKKTEATTQSGEIGPRTQETTKSLKSAMSTSPWDSSTTDSTRTTNIGVTAVVSTQQPSQTVSSTAHARLGISDITLGAGVSSTNPVTHNGGGSTRTHIPDPLTPIQSSSHAEATSVPTTQHPGSTPSSNPPPNQPLTQPSSKSPDNSSSSSLTTQPSSNSPDYSSPSPLTTQPSSKSPDNFSSSSLTTQPSRKSPDNSSSSSLTTQPSSKYPDNSSSSSLMTQPSSISPDNSSSSSLTTQPSSKSPDNSSSSPLTTQPSSKSPDNSPSSPLTTQPSSKSPDNSPSSPLTTQPSSKYPDNSPSSSLTTQPSSKSPDNSPSSPLTTQPSSKYPDNSPSSSLTTQPSSKSPDNSPSSPLTTQPSSKYPDNSPSSSLTTQPSSKYPDNSPSSPLTTQPSSKYPDNSPSSSLTTQPSSKPPDNSSSSSLTTQPSSKYPDNSPSSPLTTQPSSKSPDNSPSSSLTTQPSSKYPDNSPSSPLTTQPSSKSPDNSPSSPLTTQPSSKSPDNSPSSPLTTQPSSKSPDNSPSSPLTTQPSSKSPDNSSSISLTTQLSSKSPDNSPSSPLTTQPSSNFPDNSSSISLTTQPSNKSPDTSSSISLTTQPSSKSPDNSSSRPLTTQPSNKSPDTSPSSPLTTQPPSSSSVSSIYTNSPPSLSSIQISSNLSQTTTVHIPSHNASASPLPEDTTMSRGGAVTSAVLGTGLGSTTETTVAQGPVDLACTKNPKSTCDRVNVGKKMSDLKLCKKYYLCEVAGKKWKTKNCKGQLEFDYISQMCMTSGATCHPGCNTTETTTQGQTKAASTAAASSPITIATNPSTSGTVTLPITLTTGANAPAPTTLSLATPLPITMTTGANAPAPTTPSPATSSPDTPHVSITMEPRTAMEGGDLKFRCTVTGVTTKSRGSHIQWRLNGKKVQDAGTNKKVKDLSKKGRFQVLQNAASSELQISPTHLQDSGEVECKAVGIKQQPIVTRLPFMVLGRPLVSVTPLSASVLIGQQTLLNCIARVPSTSYIDEANTLSYTWWKGNTNIASGSALHVEDSGVYWCEAALQDLRSERGPASSCTVTVLKQEERACEQVLSGKMRWPRTSANQTARLPCAPPLTGVVRRHCAATNTTPSWQPPNFNDCVGRAFLNIEREVADIVEGLGADNSSLGAEVATRLYNLTRAHTLPPGNLNASTTATSMLADLRQRQVNEAVPDMQLAMDEFKATLHTISNLLDEMNDPSWKQLARDNPYRPVEAMRTVDIYGTIGSEMFGDIALDTSNIVMKLDCIPKNETENIKFPQWNTTRGQMEWVMADHDLITFPKETLDAVADDIPYSAFFVSASYYRSLGNIMPTGDDDKYVNSRVMSLSINGLKSTNVLWPRVKMTLQHFKVDFGNLSAVCMFWDYKLLSRGGWSQKGCRVVSTNETATTCECDHLTNFAILMSPNPTDDEHHAHVLSMISLVGCVISMVCLLLTLLMYCSMWKHVKSHHAAVLLNVCIALFIANLLFVAGSDRTEYPILCVVVAALMQYFWLAAFFLMLVEGIQLLLYIVFVFHVRRRRETALLVVCGWLMPATVVAISLGVTRTKGYGTDDYCWLSTENGLIWSFIAPVLVIICVNLVILVVVLRRVASAKVPDQRRKNKVRAAFWNIVVIAPILGVTWVFGVLSVSDDKAGLAFQYVFAILNSLQGLFIFIFHALCNKKLRETLSGHMTSCTYSRSAITRARLPLIGGKRGHYAVKQPSGRAPAPEKVPLHPSAPPASYGHPQPGAGGSGDGSGLHSIGNSSQGTTTTDLSLTESEAAPPAPAQPSAAARPPSPPPASPPTVASIPDAVKADPDPSDPKPRTERMTSTTGSTTSC